MKNFIVTLRYGVFNMQGHRKTQEDCHRAEPNLAQQQNPVGSSEARQPIEYPAHESFAFFGVYDGHGGPRASAFVAEHLHTYLLEERKNTDELSIALTQALRRLEVDFLTHSRKIGCIDGTTVAVTLVDAKARLTAASIGDSEMVLARAGKALPLLPVHTPKRNEDESKRVEAAGGRLWHGRVAHPTLNPAYFSIAVSRSIGDLMFKDSSYLQGKVSGLIAEPELKQMELGPDDEFLILACDGLWDVMSHQEAVDFCLPLLRETDDPQHTAQQLTQKAFDSGSLDNITVREILLLLLFLLKLANLTRKKKKVMIVTFRRWRPSPRPASVE